MSQVCLECSLNKLNFTGMEELFAYLDTFKLPEMPIIPDPLFGDQSDPLAEKKEKISSMVFSAILKYVKLFILDPLEVIVDLFKDIIGSLTGMWDQIVNFTIPGLGVKFMDFLTDLATQADVLISNIIDSVKDVIDSIHPLQIPNPVTVDAKNPVWEAVQKVQALIKESTLAVIKSCMDIMKLVVDKVKQAFDLAGITLGPAIDAFFEMLANIPSLVTDGINALLAMFGAAIDGAFEKIEETKQVIMGFIEKIKTVFGIDIPGVPDVSLTLSNRASNFWKEFAVLMQNWWASFTSAIVGVFTDAMALFLEKVNAFLAYVDSLVSEAKTAFVNAVNAITAGLMAAITGLPAQLAKLIEGKVTFCVEAPDVPATPTA